ncbi:hypothetical protein HMPREF1593_01933 [Escherichia coli 907391]|nr:hypothetical protein AKO63_3750 [Escherichia coli]EGB83694.1 hypothetical protein HMPREF9533_01439 [Escherichia coli MS 60-1]ESC98298.1 hypothetical protein HMPREF1593_01933 [Escherichia coli 907391]ESE34838.1 hypothetical protein HMPREF1622_02330 [Escherichia coli A35218R]EZJ94798.1 hypothetical protein AB72_3797 [Escherichia coli 1-250-04_S1_C3]KDT43944.1 hypothetical protein AD15_2885 [Escherichia coli 3-105-05_S4_C2]KEJ06828.1 hypothetical protein AD07_3900 [Escherichia coli 8-415-05_S
MKFTTLNPMLQTLCKAPVERFLNLFNQDCANDESVTDSL